MGDLQDAYEATVRENDLLKPVDSALIETGRKLAQQIDVAIEGGNERALYLAPHLMNVLKAMGATPESRKLLDAQQTEVGGKLAKLRAVKTAS